MDRLAFTRSLETQALVKLLSTDEHADLFTYEELSEAAGIDAKHHGALQSARHIVEREKGVVFETIRNVGIKRASDVEIVDAGCRAVSHIRNTAKRSIAKASCVKSVEALPNEKKAALNSHLTTVGMIHYVTTQSAQKKIEAKVTQTSKDLPVAEALAALMNGKK